MANRGVRGRVILQGTSAPLPDLLVRVFDVDGLVGEDGEDYLGEATTDASGNYTINYSTRKYGAFEANPDLVVRIYDSHLRLLHETPEQEEVTDEIRDFDDIQLIQGDVQGLLSTNATRPSVPGPDGSAQLLSGGNKIRFYLDNDQLWIDFVARIQSATTSIRMTQLITDPGDGVAPDDMGFIAVFDAGHPNVGSGASGKNISNELKLAATNNGVSVRILLGFPDDEYRVAPDEIGDLWSGLVSPLVELIQDSLESYDESVTFFQGPNPATPASPVELRKFRTSLIQPMHAKIAIVDDQEAWIFGSPFQQLCFDDTSHAIRDPRRGTKAFGSSAFGVNFPFHDVSARIVGPVVKDLDQTFAELWAQGEGPGSTDYTTTMAPPPATIPAGQNAADWSETSLQVLRTYPGNRTGYFQIGETSCLEGYQRAIREATDYVYIEDQYLWSADLMETLKYALRRSGGPQVIIVGNLTLDVPGYQGLQDSRLKDLKAFAREVGASDRLGMYTLWIHETASPKSKIIPLYLHTKVALVDDNWGTIGSANLDGNSLNVAHIYATLRTYSYGNTYGQPVQHATNARSVQPPRNVEVNVAMFNGVADQPASGAIQKLREMLWGEHLALTGAFPARPSSGWLNLWQSKADDKLQGLKADPPEVRAHRPLDFRFTKKPKCYLKRLDVKTRALEIITEWPDFDLTTGQWK